MRFLSVFILFLSSIIDGTAISAAADGVGALKSATKSAIVKSVSCPTADIIGIFELNIALAVISSLNAHRSYILPPPRPTISVSTSFVALKYSIALTTLSAAPTPCTCAGYITISAIG